MAIYAGYTGRVILTGPNNQNYNLIAHKYLLSTKTQEEDVTTAQSLPAQAGRAFVASYLPRTDVQIDGFWTSLNNPFGSPTPLQVSFTYTLQIFFDKLNVVPNVNASLLILGCEVSSSVRDAVRYTLTGVVQGSLVPADVQDYPENLPSFFPLQ